MSRKKKVVEPAPKVATISAELAVKLLASLEALASNDTYESEYDGQMMTMCHFCGWLERGTHHISCEHLTANGLIAQAYGATP